ncbi:unnamed protein product [Acanthocheilonema viteae]|uniref:Uncharacterized protein n=1 Tax=Acanthocheilonema viteae TaxID=6277 RepID=A0A498SNV8_ACAVI|nr:unnamed protein product [Acanthocheilonema viteae]
MSMKLLKEAIKLVDADDNVKSTVTVRKSGRPSKAERDRQQLAAIATISEYDPELDDITINSSMRHVMNHSRKKIAKNISLLEESRLRGKTDLFKHNIKYMIYEANCELDPGKTKQIIDFMDGRNRRRKKILRALRNRNTASAPFPAQFSSSQPQALQFSPATFSQPPPSPDERTQQLTFDGKKVKRSRQ